MFSRQNSKLLHLIHQSRVRTLARVMFWAGKLNPWLMRILVVNTNARPSRTRNQILFKDTISINFDYSHVTLYLTDIFSHLVFWKKKLIKITSILLTYLMQSLQNRAHNKLLIEIRCSKNFKDIAVGCIFLGGKRLFKFKLGIFKLLFSSFYNVYRNK